MAHTHDPPPASAAVRPTLVGRAMRFVRNWKVAVGLGVAATVAIIGAYVGVTLLSSGSADSQRQLLLPKALNRLEAGNLAEARELATELRSLPGASIAERGAALYVLGSTLAREAQEHPSPPQRRILYLVASRYLEDAQTHGFPPDREADGLLTLGRALHHGGRHALALPILRESLDRSPHATTELHRMLADSYFGLTPPKHAAALEHARAFLAIQDLSPGERHSGILLQGKILLAQGNLPAASEILAQVPDASPLLAEAVMLRARVAVEAARNEQQTTQALAAATQQLLTATIADLRALEGRPGIDREVIPQAQLLIGQCYESAGDRRAATAQFDRLRRARFGRPDGLAATFFLAELHLQERRPAAAVEMYGRALQQAGPKDAYDNPWLPLEQLEARLGSAAAALTTQGHFTEAVELTKAMRPLASEVLALRQRVSAHEGWARQLLAQAASQPTLVAETTRAQARQHFRQAGADGERIAELSIATRNYVADLASAAENYERGQGYRQAAQVWRAFLRQNPPQQRPEATVGLGEALLALDQIDAALTTLQGCRDEFPTHPATYRARLLESQGWQEKGDLAKARELLLDNLYRHALTPKSSDWRDSLFALGQLLYRQASEEETKSRIAGVNQTSAEAMKEGLKLLEQSYATYQETIRILTEAVQRYPTATQAVQARYWIAESYRHSALAPRRKLAVTNIETSRLALNRQITQELEAALDEYQRLVAELSDEQELPQRTTVELSLLRNCYFGRADVLFDLARYEEAILAYSAATNRYQHDPESLEAYVQIATCYRRLKRPNEARGTLEQARVVLQRIRPDADFLRTTRLDRQQWNDLLGWLRTL